MGLPPTRRRSFASFCLLSGTPSHFSVPIPALYSHPSMAGRRGGRVAARRLLALLCSAEEIFAAAPQRGPRGWCCRRCGRRLAHGGGGAQRCPVPEVWDEAHHVGVAEAAAAGEALACVGAFCGPGGPRKWLWALALGSASSASISPCALTAGRARSLHVLLIRFSPGCVATIVSREDGFLKPCPQAEHEWLVPLSYF